MNDEFDLEEDEQAHGSGVHPLKWIASHPLVIIVPLLILIACYATLWTMASRIRKQAVTYLGDALDADLKAERIDLTPALRINLENVTITSRNSELKLPDVKAEKIMLAADVPSLLRGKIQLSEVFLLGAEVTVYQEPDGSYNIAHWLEKTSTCRPGYDLESFPGRINIRNSRIVMEPPPGAHWIETRELASVEGAVGLTRDGKIAVNLEVTAFNSPVTLKGGMTPCKPESITLKGISDMFDFSALRDNAAEFLPKAPDSILNLPGGSGRMSFAMEGSLLSPYVAGAVSLQDFDAEFTYSEKIFVISNFNSGLGTEKVTGSGSVDFHSDGIPFNFTMVLENVSLRRHTARMQGFRYSPQGKLSGVLKLSGLLEEGQTEISNGNITITNGEINLPDPGFARRPSSKSVTAHIPFNELTAKVYSSKNKLRLAGISISADEWTAKGALWVDSSFLYIRNVEGLEYYIELELETGNLSAIAADVPSVRGKAGGMLKADLKVSGRIGTTDDLYGSGSIKTHKGFIGNPYHGTASYSYQTMDFDMADIQFTIGTHLLRLNSATITGDGIDVEASGNIGYDGKLELTAKAVLSPERARDFAGLAGFVAGRDMFTLATYSARCDISGDIRNPESTWRKPEVTRWGR